MVVLRKEYGVHPRAQLAESTMIWAEGQHPVQVGLSGFTRRHLADQLVEHPGAPAAGQAEAAGFVLEEILSNLL